MFFFQRPPGSGRGDTRHDAGDSTGSDRPSPAAARETDPRSHPRISDRSRTGRRTKTKGTLSTLGSIYTRRTRKRNFTLIFCFLLLKFLEDFNAFCWTTNTPVLDLMFALGFKARVDSLAWVLRCLHTMVSSDSPLVRHLLTSWRIFFDLCRQTV